MNAQGKEITDVLPEPGIVVRSSPTWYPYSAIMPQTQVMKGTQCRLTKTSGRWDVQPDLLTWDPADGMATAHLRACSWWVWLLPFLVPSSTAQPSSPAPALPPIPEITIEPSDCVATGASDSSPVDCGVLRMPVNCVMTVGTTVPFSAQFTATVAGQLGVAPSTLAALLTRLTVQVSGSITMDASFGFTYQYSATTGSLIPGQTVVADRCYSGEMSEAVADRVFTLTCGSLSTQLKFPDRVIKVLCLTLDPACGNELSPCNSGPLKKEEVYPSAYKLCAGDPLKCH
ncbi:MAG: hypothetical protein K8J09_13965 [Planctomycetes bacterium]|nr:hypothetical protein [Planctomycetota bacterium]MCC7398108.1 hypothetical protein [Planctomycetota bacterium]